MDVVPDGGARRAAASSRRTVACGGTFRGTRTLLRMRLGAGRAARGRGVGSRSAARGQSADRTDALAEALLGGVGAARAAGPVAGIRRVAGVGARGDHRRVAHPAGAAGLPPGRGEPPFRLRHGDSAARRAAGAAFRLRRARPFPGDSLVGGLYLRIRRRRMGRACGGGHVDRDLDVRRAVALHDDARPLGALRGTRNAHSRSAARLDRLAGGADLCGDPLPLCVQNSRHVVAARGRSGLSGLRIHVGGAGRQGFAGVARAADLQLVLRPAEPLRPARGGVVLDRDAAPCGRIRSDGTARLSRGLRRRDDLLPRDLPFAPHGTLPLGRAFRHVPLRGRRLRPCAGARTGRRPLAAGTRRTYRPVARPALRDVSC